MPLVRTTEPVGVGVPATSTVTDSAWVVLMLFEDGDTVTVGVIIPTPENETVCGELLELLENMLSTAVLLPAALGMKVTEIEQLSPGFKLLEHELLTLKLLLLDPLSENWGT